MIAAAIHIVAILLMLGVGVYSAVCDPYRRPSLHLAILAAGIIAGVAVTVSGFYLLEYWAELMEHVDFTELMREDVNPRRLPSKLYFLPASTMVLGAAGAFAFGRLFYGILRERGDF